MLSNRNLLCSPWFQSVKSSSMALFIWVMMVASLWHSARLCSIPFLMGTGTEGRDSSHSVVVGFFQRTPSSASVMPAGSRVSASPALRLTSSLSSAAGTACCCSRQRSVTSRELFRRPTTSVISVCTDRLKNAPERLTPPSRRLGHG